MSGLSLETCTSNLKPVAVTVLNWTDWPVRCTQTHTQTHIEQKQYVLHSLHSLGRDNKSSDAAHLTLVLLLILSKFCVTGCQFFQFDLHKTCTADMVSCASFFILYKFLAPSRTRFYSIQETCRHVTKTESSDWLAAFVCMFLVQKLTLTCIIKIWHKKAVQETSSNFLTACYKHKPQKQSSSQKPKPRHEKIYESKCLPGKVGGNCLRHKRSHRLTMDLSKHLEKFRTFLDELLLRARPLLMFHFL